VTVDLSYLSLSAAVPQLESVAFTERALMVALVKPMFELHLERPPTDDSVLRSALAAAVTGISTTGKWRPLDSMESPQRGARGAIEFFVYARRGRDGTESKRSSAAVAQRIA
jgi:predicted rRNA methylase YqxC with S4 and FtsJ domains